jgi:hypothetical protein
LDAVLDALATVFLAKPIPVDTTLALVLSGHDVHDRCAALLAYFADIFFFLDIASKGYTSFADCLETKLAQEISISFVTISINDPDPVSVVPESTVQDS